MQGYYKCKCGEEAVSTFPYKKLICQKCGKDIPITKRITDKEAEKIIKTKKLGLVGSDFRYHKRNIHDT